MGAHMAMVVTVDMVVMAVTEGMVDMAGMEDITTGMATQMATVALVREHCPQQER